MSAITVLNAELNLRPLVAFGGLVTITTSVNTYADMTALGGGAGPGISASCTQVLVSLEGGPVRETADASAPTSSVGRVLATTFTQIMHINDFKARKWIRDAAAGADAKLWVQQLGQN